MKKYNYTLVILIMITNSFKSQTIFDYLTAINATISTIPVIFEGQVTSVEIYAGDDVGNKLSNSTVAWNGNIGFFINPANGERGFGYSKARIKVCKVYKGNVKSDVEIEVLTRSSTLNTIYLMRTGSGTSADTSIQYINVPPSHGAEAYDVMMPKSSYSKKLYFCDKLQPIVGSNYSGADYYSNLHTFLEMPFNHPISIAQPDGSYMQVIAYCAIVPYAFDDQSQLQLFLNQIQTINPNPTDFCRSEIKEGAVSVAEINGNPHKITVYPNPSNTDQGIKIKFTLDDEQDVTISLKDLQGKQIVNTPLGKQKNIMYDLNTKLEAGTYFLQVIFGTNTQTFKVTKN